MSDVQFEHEDSHQGKESILDEAKNLLIQGKRFMALEDFKTATDHLEQSCQLFDAFYGVAKRECADAYLEYGLALVALANIEAGSGTDKIVRKVPNDGDEECEDEEGEDEEGDDEAEGQAEGESGEAKVDDDCNMDTDEPETTLTNDIIMASQASTSEQKPSHPTPGTSGDNDDNDDNDDKESEDEEATTIEIAWEVLCLAKRLYMTDESMESRLKLAETLQKIGEISIEWDNNDNAVSILEECLNIRKAILPPEDRLIASTYYHLGLAHSFKTDTIKANENFQNAISVIEKRIASLSVDLEKAKEAQDTVTIGTYEREINELKDLLPDMTMRLDDSKEDVDKTDVLKRTREEMQLEDDEAHKVCSDKTKPVGDITHLVKRKVPEN